MTRQADWYFDFVSPFSYLQLEAFDRFPADLDITLKPVLFAGLLGHWEHKGPLLTRFVRGLNSIEDNIP